MQAACRQGPFPSWHSSSLTYIIAQVNVELFYEAGFTALLSPRSRCYPFGDSRTRNLWRTNIQGELTGRNCQARWNIHPASVLTGSHYSRAQHFHSGYVGYVQIPMAVKEAA